MPEAERFLNKMDAQGELRIIAHQPRQCTMRSILGATATAVGILVFPQRTIVFLEIYIWDPSKFSRLT